MNIAQINKINDFRVLLLYPNQRNMSLVPPSIALFSKLLKDSGVAVKLFDTSSYNMGYSDSDEIEAKNLTVRPVKKEDKIRLLDNDVFQDINNLVINFQPNLIAATATDSTIQLTIELLKSIKHHNILNCVGGVFPTLAPEKAIRYQEIDMICLGEGEIPLIQLCEKLSKNENYSDIPNLWVKNGNGKIIKNKINSAINIDSLPPLDFSIFDENRLKRMMGGKVYKMIPIETHRGCPFMCTYCGSPNIDKIYKEQTNSRYYRQKTLTKVKENLFHYINKWQIEYFFFWADTFFAYADKEIDEFCNFYQDIKLPFFCQARPETINEFKIKRLKEVGLDRIAIGIEHGNEKFRKEILKRNYSNEQAIKSLGIVYKNDVSFSLNNIIGLPDETPELVMDTINLNRQIKGFDDASCSIFQPYYGTPLRDLCVKKGYIDHDLICPHNAENSLLDMPNFSKEKIAGLQRTFNMYIRFPKDRWPEIKEAENFTPEGNQMWKQLSEELVRNYF